MNKIMGASAASILALAGVSHAAVIDFGTYAEDTAAKLANTGKTNVAEVGGLADGSIIILDGVTMAVSATLGGDASGAFFYLDGISGGLPAGAGVCKQLNADKQCTPSSDDNAQGDEELIIEFTSGTYNLSGFQFRTSSHPLITSGPIKINVNDGGYQNFEISTLAGLSDVTKIAFMAGDTGNGTLPFYVEKLTATLVPNITDEVPLPAGALLFGSALALAGAARRKAQA